MSTRKTKITREQIYTQTKNTLLIILGCLILAIASAVFIVPADLLTGGINSIAITIQYILKHYYDIEFQLVDIVTFVLEAVLFLIGLFILGKKFSAHTLLASIVYPAFFALFYRTGILNFIPEALVNSFSEPYLGKLLCGVFGGVLVGAGVAITFLGGGSTGGVDIIVVIIAKYTPIKEGLGTGLFDYSLILIGVIVRYEEPSIIPAGLIGLTSAFVAAFMIQILYVSENSFSLVEIISDKYEEIIDFIQNKLDRGCTIYFGEGGYTKEPKRIVKAALKKKEAEAVRNFMSEVDKKAFMIITGNITVNGEGFVPFVTPRVSLLRRFIVGEPIREARKKEKEDR